LEINLSTVSWDIQKVRWPKVLLAALSDKTMSDKVFRNFVR